MVIPAPPRSRGSTSPGARSTAPQERVDARRPAVDALTLDEELAVGVGVDREGLLHEAPTARVRAPCVGRSPRAACSRPTLPSRGRRASSTRIAVVDDRDRGSTLSVARCRARSRGRQSGCDRRPRVARRRSPAGGGADPTRGNNPTSQAPPPSPASRRPGVRTRRPSLGVSTTGRAAGNRSRHAAARPPSADPWRGPAPLPLTGASTGSRAPVAAADASAFAPARRALPTPGAGRHRRFLTMLVSATGDTDLGSIGRRCVRHRARSKEIAQRPRPDTTRLSVSV